MRSPLQSENTTLQIPILIPIYWILKEIHKEVSLTHTGIKQEPYIFSALQDTHEKQLQQDTLQLQTDMQILMESMNTPKHQYTVPLDTNSVALQQQLSKMKAEIRHLSR